MTSASPFERHRRVLACPGCGAPADVPVAGGRLTCRYCATISDWGPRPAALAPAPSLLDEPERLRRLRAQRSAAAEEPPASVLPYLQAADPEAKSAAYAAFQACIAELQSGAPSTDADARLYWLTLGLYNAWAGPAQALRQRGLVEAALEALTQPRWRQALVGMMVRNAAREGDLVAAQQWHELLDASSDNLLTESAYRLSTAYLDTARADFAAVLRTLGHEVAAVPLVAGDELLTSVLRANALERHGETEKAAVQLAALMQHNAAYPTLLGRIVAANPTLALCPASLLRGQEVARAAS